MTPRRLRPLLASAILAAFAVGLSACATPNSYGGGYYPSSAPSAASAPARPRSPWEVSLRYERPTSISRWGRRVTVVPFTDEGESGFTHRVSDAIDATSTFEVAESNVQLGVSGEVLESAFSDERFEEHPHRCTRTVQERRTRRVPVEVEIPDPPAGSRPTAEDHGRRLGVAIGTIITAAMGAPTPNYSGRPTRTEYRDEEYTEPVEQQYDCTELVRSVRATFRVRVRIAARTRPIRTVFEREFAIRDEQRTTGLRGADEGNREPPAVDGPGLLRTLWDRGVAEFSNAVLPEATDVDLEFGDCHDPRCAAAVSLVRGGSPDEAERVLTSIVDEDSAPRRRRTSVDAATALYDRGLVRAYGHSLLEGIDDIRRAIELVPGQRAWEQRLAALREIQREAGIESPAPAPPPRARQPPRRRGR